MSGWYEPPAATGNGRFIHTGFDVRGIAPIGYTLFAVALGIFAGTVCRKVMPAMGVTAAKPKPPGPRAPSRAAPVPPPPHPGRDRVRRR